jgi:Zn-dependent metalloprotease
MKIFAYHAEDENPVSKHRGIDELATALRRVHLSGMKANQIKHQFKEVEDSLKSLLESETEPIRSFVGSKKHLINSEFESVSSQWFSFTKTHIVKFRQKYKSIPVYGAQVTVEVDEKNELLAINSAIGDPNGLNASPKVEGDEIKHLIEEKKGYNLAGVTLNPTLYYYYDSNKKRWRLVYITDIRYKDPENQVTQTENNNEFKPIPEMVDYVIDAHTKEIVVELPRMRTLQKKLR